MENTKPEELTAASEEAVEAAAEVLTEVESEQAAGQPPVKEKMPVGSAIAYTIGYSGINVSWYMINSYLMIFYTDIVGLAAGAISMIMLIARIWDAVNDPMMGAIVDRTRSKWGKFKPYIVIAPPFLAIFNILTFTVFPLQGAAKVAVCLICYILVGMAYTAVQVAVNGLVNRLSRSSQVKMDIISMSQIGSALIQTILGALVPVMLLAFTMTPETPDARSYFVTTIIISIAMIPMFWFCAWKAKEIKDEAEPAMQAQVDKAKKEKKPLMKSLKALLKNGQLIIGIVSVFLGAMGAIARMSLLTYYVVYAAGLPMGVNYQMLGVVFPVVTFLQMVGNLTLPFFTRKLGKKKTFILFNIITIGALLVLFFFAKGSTVILIGASAVFGFGLAGSSISYGFICDAIEFGDYKYGVREEGLAFSLMSLGVKCATAITGAVGVLLIAAVGYNAGAEVQSPATVTGINVVVNIIPAVLMGLSMVIMIWYRLDEKKVATIAERMKLRREGHETREEQLQKYTDIK